MSEWMLICNSRYFDIKGAFAEAKTVTWPQVDGVQAGDIAYFYVNNPVRAILYQCRVQETGLHQMEDSAKEYVKHPLFYDQKQIYMRLEVIRVYPEGLFADEEIKKHGASGLQVSSKITAELSDYIRQTGKTETKDVREKRAS